MVEKIFKIFWRKFENPYLALPRRLQLVRDSNHLPGAFLSLDKDMMILQKYLSSHTVTGKTKKLLSAPHCYSSRVIHKPRGQERGRQVVQICISGKFLEELY